MSHVTTSQEQHLNVKMYFLSCALITNFYSIDKYEYTCLITSLVGLAMEKGFPLVMIGWDNVWTGHAGRWVWIGLPCSTLLSITWAVQYVDSPFYCAIFERYNIRLWELQTFCYFSQWHCCHKFSRLCRQISRKKEWATAHATVSVNWRQTRCSDKQSRVKWFQSPVKRSSMFTGKSLATLSGNKFLILSESHFYCKLLHTFSLLAR